MKNFALVAIFALLLAAPPAFAQTADQAGQPGNMPESGFGPKAMLAAGKIAEIDLGRGTLTLDNGMQFTLPPSFQYTSFPALGLDVQVTYSEQGGQNVAHIIEVGSSE